MEEHRQLFIDLCLSTNTIIMNTQFQKRDDQLATHRMPTNTTPPITRPHYEMIDYWLTPTRWKNCITNVDTKLGANLTTDHLPMTATIRNKLAKIDPPKRTGRNKYEICNAKATSKYNEKIHELMHTDNDNLSFKDTLKKAAEDTIPSKTTTMKKDDISQEL